MNVPLLYSEQRHVSVTCMAIYKLIISRI